MLELQLQQIVLEVHCKPVTPSILIWKYNKKTNYINVWGLCDCLGVGFRGSQALFFKWVHRLAKSTSLVAIYSRKLQFVKHEVSIVGTHANKQHCMLAQDIVIWVGMKKNLSQHASEPSIQTAAGSEMLKVENQFCHLTRHRSLWDSDSPKNYAFMRRHKEALVFSPQRQAGLPTCYPTVLLKC